MFLSPWLSSLSLPVGESVSSSFPSGTSSNSIKVDVSWACFSSLVSLLTSKPSFWSKTSVQIVDRVDIVEVDKDNKPNDQAEYRLRNSWFNHQGILLDDFLITENTISINTFVSQAYFLESYLIDRVTGKTKRTFYRFDNPDFFYNIKKLEKNATSDSPLFNEKGKLSLKTIKSLSLEPWETFYFEGKCLEGIGLWLLY